MPSIRDLLGDEAALRALVATTPPRELARRIRSVLRGSALAVVDELVLRIFQLYIELHGMTAAEEFCQQVRR